MDNVELIGPASANPIFTPGDFVLVHGGQLTSRIIQFGQGLRYRGADKQYCYFNHAALVVDTDGGLIEAEGRGVCAGHINEYNASDYALVHTDMSDEDRTEAVNFAKDCLGDKYSFLTIGCISVSLLTGTKLTFGYQGHMICSGLVSRCLERGQYVFPRDAAEMMPADLASYFKVVPPTKSIGFQRP